MESTKNLCAQIPESLHARVRSEQEQSGKTLSQYITELITKYYDYQKEGKKMDGNCVRQVKMLAKGPQKG